MTRKSEGATAGLRRGRTLATAGLGAATLIGGLVYAAPAMAATTPTVTLTAPAQISNDGTTTSNLTIEVNNSATGSADIANAALALQLTIPSGLTCGDVTLTGSTLGGTVTSGPAFTSSSAGTTTGTCYYQTGNLATAPTPSVAAGANPTYGYTIAVDGEVTHVGAPSTFITGTIGSTASLDATDAAGVFQSVIASSAAQSSALVSPHGPSFNAAPGAATIYQPYSFKLVKDAGFPAADPTTSASAGGYTALGIDNSDTTPPTSADVVRDASTGDVVQVTTGTGTSAKNDYYISLNDTAGDGEGFYFDTATGEVVYGTLDDTGSPATSTFKAGSSTKAILNPTYTWVIVANNGVNGTTSSGVNFGLTGIASKLQSSEANDVASAAFELTVQFSDVAPTSTFANDIYAAAGTTPAVINGYLDGTFRGTNPVTRGNFAAFAVRELNLTPKYSLSTGPCTPVFNPSEFKDVSNNAQFCSEINELASLGIVNGYTDGTFRPNTVVSRQVVTAFFFRMNAAYQGASVKDATPTDTTFKDVTKKNIFSGDIAWAATATPTAIVSGYGDGTFRPTGVATRQVAAAYLVRLGQDYLGLYPGVKA